MINQGKCVAVAKEFTTPEAATKLGISPDQFRRLAEKRRIEPVGSYTNPHHKSGPECPLWSARDIGRLKRTNDYQAILDRKKPDPERARARRMDRFARKYPRVTSVLPDACTAMFNLNRYAKWSSCSRDHNKEIYDLKNRFVELLYSHRLADRVYLHIQPLPEQLCHRCAGIGQDGWSDDECERCDGTGIYREATELVFVVFSFLIGEVRFSWHQPAHLVAWEYQTTDPPDTWDTPPIKSIEMKPSKFAEAKDLIRYAIQLLNDTVAEELSV